MNTERGTTWSTSQLVTVNMCGVYECFHKRPSNKSVDRVMYDLSRL